MEPLNKYCELAKILLSVEQLEQDPLLLPDTFGDPPRVNIGDLTNVDDQKLCCEVCDRTAMTPAIWADLGESERISWMQKAVAKGVRSNSDEPQSADDGPPKALMDKLTPQERMIIEYLWNRGTTNVKKLESYLTKKTGKTPQPDALRKAINRLQSHLCDPQEKHIKIFLKRPLVHFKRDNVAGK